MNSLVKGPAPATAMTPEMEHLKGRLKATWMSGDYGRFAKYLEPGALDFLKRLNLTPGTHLLDVACGAGQIAIPAAKAGVRVTGIDIAANLIQQARERARTEGVNATFKEGDAEMLSCMDGEFDVVVSLIGAMFAPRPEHVAAELLRACRPGGRIVMANWTSAGHVGQMFKVMGQYVPPSPLMPSPLLWGNEEIMRQRLGDGVTRLDCTKRMYPMDYPFPPAEVVEFFRTYYGPTHKAFAALDADKQEALRRDLVDLWSRNNRSGDGATTRIEAEYLEVAAVRK